jgi:hypothetical protein
MAIDQRPQIKWASFSGGVRINASALETPAVAHTETVRIYRENIHGDDSLVVYDPSLPDRVVVPWHNVGTVVYLEAPADAPEIAAKAKPVAKAKSLEPQA